MRPMRAALTGLAALAVVAGLLLVPAVLLHASRAFMMRALVLLAIYALFGVVGYVALAVLRPASFDARQQWVVAPKEGRQPLIDVVGIIAYVTFVMAWHAFIPVDVAALHLLPPPPLWASALGLVAAILGGAVGYLAVWENAFATPAVQTSRGQHVVSTGVYGVIRHPVYSGNLLFYAGTALWLGSLAAFAATAIHLAATLARIGIEERELRAHLPGYDAYAAQVRARLVPFVF